MTGPLMDLESELESGEMLEDEVEEEDLDKEEVRLFFLSLSKKGC